MEEIGGWSEGKNAGERKGEREKGREEKRGEEFEHEQGEEKSQQGGREEEEKEERGTAEGWVGGGPFPTSTNPLHRRETRYSRTLCSPEKQPDCPPKQLILLLIFVTRRDVNRISTAQKCGFYSFKKWYFLFAKIQVWHTNFLISMNGTNNNLSLVKVT